MKCIEKDKIMGLTVAMTRRWSWSSSGRGDDDHVNFTCLLTKAIGNAEILSFFSLFVSKFVHLLVVFYDAFICSKRTTIHALPCMLLKQQQIVRVREREKGRVLLSESGIVVGATSPSSYIVPLTTITIIIIIQRNGNSNFVSLSITKSDRRRSIVK